MARWKIYARTNSCFFSSLSDFINQKGLIYEKGWSLKVLKSSPDWAGRGLLKVRLLHSPSSRKFITIDSFHFGIFFLFTNAYELLSYQSVRRLSPLNFSILKILQDTLLFILLKVSTLQRVVPMDVPICMSKFLNSLIGDS